MVVGAPGPRRAADDTPRGYREQAGSPNAIEGPTGYTHLRMDPLDHLLALPDGLRCTVCDERVPATRIRVLAHRDDLTFLQIDCGSCSSASLGFVLDGRADEPMPRDERPPISGDDVLDMHQFLATWRGSLTGLMASGGSGRSDRSGAESSR